MGKTRLALEATRSFALSITIVEVVDDLLRTDFQALGTSKTTQFAYIVTKKSFALLLQR